MQRLTVNGRDQQARLAGERSLLEVLREDFGLTGAKPACGEGRCGACTVLLDSEPTRSCVTPAVEAVGRSVTTLEGLARDQRLRALQQAFLESGALQCGYCTPGMLVAAAALLTRDPDPSLSQIRAALEGHICRCCVYGRIERAVARAAAARTDEAAPPCDAIPRSVVFAEFRAKVPWDLSAPERRECFELLGDGLVVVLEPPACAGVDAHRLVKRGEGGGAWLHVAASGEVTAFTGKMDMGQDNRTALSLLVAEELGVAPAAVRLVMGDTDLCPFDRGTFGSRSLPDAGEDLRRTAASARELLVEIAAARVNAAPERLDVREGAVRTDQGTLFYGALVQGMRRIERASGSARVTAAARWRLAGHPAMRATGRQLVDGTHRFPADISRPGMLHGCVLRAPAYGMRLGAVDLTAAEAVPGATLVHDDEFVGAAAADRRVAARALAAVRASWTKTQQPTEQQLSAHLRAHPVDLLGWQRATEQQAGDVAGALAAADVRLERTYTTAYIAHVALEPRVALAEWEGDRVTVWTGTQQPFYVRYELAAALGVEEEQVRIIVPDTGGGFGGKHTEAEAIAAARLARVAGRPVRVALTREEEFRFTYFRPASVIDIRSGASRDGAINAWDFHNLNSGAAGLTTPYRTRDWRVSYQPADSPLPQGPYRTLAATANNFARESHIDELAHALELDPLTLRLHNLADERLAAVLRSAAERASWPEGRRTRKAGSGMGLAVGVEKGGRVATCAQVRVSGGALEILRIVAAYDCGAIVNPAAVESQIEGALVMGLGGALFEAIHFDAGRILNASLRSYRVPRFSDVPPIEIVLLDRPEIPSAGAGETPIIALAPALANAIFAATGRRIRSLPLLSCGALDG